MSTSKNPEIFSNHYVYTYYNPLKQNQEFYIGESGTEDRWLYHLEEAKRFIERKKSQKWIGKNADNPHKTRTIMKILEAGLEPKIEKVMEGVTEQESKAEEIRLIAYYGRANLGLGPLTNLTNGGDGCVGYKWTDEQKEKLKNRPNGMTDNNHSKEAKRKMSESKKGKDTYAKGKILYTDGEINKYFDENTQPDGWEIGQTRDEPHSNKGKKWYNNGTDVKLCYENEQPLGWELGYPPNKGKNSSHSNGLSKEHSKKIGEFRKGKKWYNNGEQQGQHYPDKQPEGWILGMFKYGQKNK